MNYTKTWAQIEKEKKEVEVQQLSGTRTLGAGFALLIILVAALLR